MNEYGSYDNLSFDYREIAVNLKENGAIVFAWSPNEIDCFIVFMSMNFKKLGIMPFGGNPEGRVYVALYGKGAAHHFNLAKDTDPSYIQEKMLCTEFTATQMSMLFEKINKELT